ncbi:cadherin-6 [Electrophorus electricus]|uniref:cadherin-6 n=1 Tax=Electrophorus electricus TaxID=8005 RepID=UPI0015D003C0|nr:cadherin-6 [Electrophorus electricus]
MRTWAMFLLWVCAWAARSAHARALPEGTLGEEGTGRRRPEGGEETLRRSRRGWMWKQFFLQEEYTGTDYQYIGKLHSDMDRGDGTVMYVLTGEGAGTIFVIDATSGDLHATRSLDREEKASYILRAQAVDKRNGVPLEPETEFIVKLHDINDNEPKFEKEVYMASVPERSHIGTSVTQVTAHDADDEMFGMSAKLVYSISQGHPYFSVEPNTGIIRTALGPSDMDREQREQYQVVIEAKDMAGQRGGLTGITTVNITLTDVNDNPPQFSQSVYQFSVPELAPAGAGAVAGRVRALDADIGRNAEMDYTVVGGDGLDAFDIATDGRTQEGVLTVKKVLDYERKKSYTLQLQVRNTHPDPRYVSVDSKDLAMVRISVEDVDEPPRFERPSYVLEVKEDAAVGTTVSSVSAADPDIRRVPVKYTIDRHTDVDRIFNVHSGNGSIFLQKPLDREDLAWHNISVIAAEFNNPQQTSRVPVYIRVLDVNDNAPTLASVYETFVCENGKAGQKIQTITAVDPDEPPGGHRFYFSLAPESSVRANFSVRDNDDNTASILTRRTGFRRTQQSAHAVAVVISDATFPMRSSTGTLTVRVCTCDHSGNMEACGAEALGGAAGLSTGALVAILLCILILLLIVVLFAAMKRQKKKEPLIMSKEDVRDNVVSYNDEGGGEEDTQAFDIGALRHPEAMEECSKLRRDILPSEPLYAPAVTRRAAAPARDDGDVRDFISQRVQEHDGSPAAPPYDSLATYAYEGSGSVAESLSSLGSASSNGAHDYNYLSEWGPRFRKLADMYGGDDDDWDS